MLLKHLALALARRNQPRHTPKLPEGFYGPVTGEPQGPVGKDGKPLPLPSQGFGGPVARGEPGPVGEDGKPLPLPPYGFGGSVTRDEPGPVGVDGKPLPLPPGGLAGTVTGIQGPVGQDGELPAPPPKGLTQPITGLLGPQGQDGEYLPAPPRGFAGPVAHQLPGPPKDRVLREVEGDDEATFQAFLAMSASEVYAALEPELAQLSPQELEVLFESIRQHRNEKWNPEFGPQVRCLTSKADIVLYGGQAGGGKSDLVLGLALTEHKRSLIMRREYDDLSFLTERAIEINGTRDGYAGAPHPTLRTKDGRRIEFRAAQRIDSVERRQGQPFDFLGIDEAAQFQESQIRFLFGWLRTTEEGQRVRVVMASNPPLSDEGQWLISMFAPWLDPQHPNPAKAGELRWFVSDEEGEDKEVVGQGPHPVGARMVKAKSRTFIPARLSDNWHLTKTDDYQSQLDNTPEPLRSALRDGNFMAARKDDAWQVIPTEWIRQAQARWTERPPPNQPMTCVSIDPAGGGKDAATIAHRFGLWFGPVASERGPQTADGRFIGAKALMARKNNCQVVVDVGGGYGGETINIMKDNDVPATGYRGADASTAKAVGSNLHFANRRAQDWYQFREALDPASPDKIALPPDPELAADLGTPRMNARVMQTRGIIQIESKEDIRLRLGRSPDKGDAVVVCRAYGGLLEFRRKDTPRFSSRVNVGTVQAKRLGWK